jgi:tagaturonate epimerase
MKLGKFSMGIGDRFGNQGIYQLQAFELAMKQGIEITPVWNKSNREHMIVHTVPEDVRKEADGAAAARKWERNYFVDADHINNSNVDKFIAASDFFTIDVADFIGKPATEKDISTFISTFKNYEGSLYVPGIARPFNIDKKSLREIAGKYHTAIREAGAIYRTIAGKKGQGSFIAEVSMDEVTIPQSPIELFFIMGALALEEINFTTIAPKFTGRFNKGVDYEGDINAFAREFEEDILVIDFAVKEFKLNPELKLSIHSGSDKFSIYPEISRIIRKHDKGIHLKTAGTTWLEEVIGLSMAGGEALRIAKGIYAQAYERREDLCAPYASVIDIHPGNLPGPETVNGWSSEKFSGSLRHIPGHSDFNPDLRQLIHVGYKVAAEYGNVFFNAIKKNADLIGQQVFENLYERHIRRIFL